MSMARSRAKIDAWVKINAWEKSARSLTSHDPIVRTMVRHYVQQHAAPAELPGLPLQRELSSTLADSLGCEMG